VKENQRCDDRNQEKSGHGQVSGDATQTNEFHFLSLRLIFLHQRESRPLADIPRTRITESITTRTVLLSPPAGQRDRLAKWCQALADD
jgi:hypothetical protein